ncbi:MAG: helix-hairpin-helix domain-containing protein, partial [Calditrichaeota bacterium]|nr:helix-hairpin-helix domain-containing protein [Calditrichota bacterium]
MILFKSPAFPQETDPLEPWMDLIQEDPAIAEILEDLLEHPLPVNDADREDWLKILLLPASAVDSILSYRERSGGFKSIREIKSIIGKERYLRIRPFITLRKTKAAQIRLTQRNYSAVEVPDEIKEKTYRGSNLYSYSKITYRYNPYFSAGLVSQKDIGETDFNDYWTGFIRYQTKRWRLILGSYYLNFGHGLLFSSPFGRIKSSMVTLPFTAKRDGAYPYIGSAENFGNTGFLFETVLFSKSALRLIFARNLRDGRFNPATLQITGFDYSGYHRTLSEIRRKDLISEQILGVNLTRQILPGLLLGLSVARFDYDPPIAFKSENVSASDLRKNRFHFRGSRLRAGSFYYDCRLGNLYLSGEWVVADPASPAVSQSFFVDRKSAKFGVLFWRLSKNFQSPSGRVLDDNGPFPRAEQGIYASFSWNKENRNWNFYKLIKKQLWRGYSNPLPVLKDEWLSEFNYRLSSLSITSRLRHKLYQQFESKADSSAIRVLRQSNQFRLQCAFRTANNVNLKTRIEIKKTKNPSEKGFLVFQDVNFKVGKSFQCNLRVTFFQTDSYNSRIYEYETDLPGSFSNYPLYGQGFKWYFRIGWQPDPRFKFWFKYRYLHLNDRDLNDIDFGRVEKP